MLLCELCGAQNPDDAKVCSQCGDMLVSIPQKDTSEPSTATKAFLISVVLLIIAYAVGSIYFMISPLENTPRSKPSRVRDVDLRAIATALEAYFIDNNTYPSSCAALTTPVAFLSELPYDPFAAKHTPYCYYIDPAGKGWILWSAGPDKKHDLTSQNIAGIYKPEDLNMPNNPALLALTYDPTNGANSHGDIWRMKQ
jgi:hypothetical protein